MNLNPLIKTQKIIMKKFKNWIPLSIQIFYYLKDILDPEYPNKIYTFGIVSFEGIFIEILYFCQIITIDHLLIPTIKICSMSPLMGISIQNKIYQKNLIKRLHQLIPKTWNWRFSIEIPNYSHLKSLNISKQLNDKERISAALENFGIRKVIEECYEKA